MDGTDAVAQVVPVFLCLMGPWQRNRETDDRDVVVGVVIRQAALLRWHFSTLYHVELLPFLDWASSGQKPVAIDLIRKGLARKDALGSVKGSKETRSNFGHRFRKQIG